MYRWKALWWDGRYGFQEDVFKGAISSHKSVWTYIILILPFLPRCENRIRTRSVKQWPWNFDTHKTNFPPSVQRVAIWPFWLNYNPPAKKEYGLQKTCEIVNIFFFEWDKASSKYVSIWKVTVGRFPPGVHIVFGIYGVRRPPPGVWVVIIWGMLQLL